MLHDLSFMLYEASRLSEMRMIRVFGSLLSPGKFSTPSTIG